MPLLFIKTANVLALDRVVLNFFDSLTFKNLLYTNCIQCSIFTVDMILQCLLLLLILAK